MEKIKEILKDILSKIVWGLKQLLPLTYRSRYEENGKKYFHVWRMWFGRCFSQDKVEVK